MSKQRMTEIMVGVFVALGLASLFMLAMKVSNLSAFAEDEGYQITARFENIGGLKVRSPVTMAGVRIGRVADIRFDQETFEAVVTLSIYASNDRIPRDSSASIYTAGLLGEQYVSLEPGGDTEFLAAGDEIRLTQSALVLEQMVGRFIFDKAAEAGP